MTDILSVASGWTELLGPFTLRADGVPLNLTGYTVSIIIRDSFKNLINLGGEITVLDQSLFPGQVTYEPVETDFVFSSAGTTYRQAYTIRWKVVAGDGSVGYFPNGGANTVGVYQL